MRSHLLIVDLTALFRKPLPVPRKLKPTPTFASSNFGSYVENLDLLRAEGFFFFLVRDQGIVSFSAC